VDDQKEKKEGISVKELEGFVKKYRYEAFLVAMFALAGIFGMGIIWRCFWSVLFAMAGAIIGSLLPEKISKMLRSITEFVLKQDKSTQLILAGAALVLSILVCPLIFLLMGLHAGKSLHMMMMEIGSQQKR
jgi:Kef-type K+ transport system membrane component KefB